MNKTYPRETKELVPIEILRNGLAPNPVDVSFSIMEQGVRPAIGFTASVENDANEIYFWIGGMDPGSYDVFAKVIAGAEEVVIIVDSFGVS